MKNKSHTYYSKRDESGHRYDEIKTKLKQYKLNSATKCLAYWIHGVLDFKGLRQLYFSCFVIYNIHSLLSITGFLDSTPATLLG